MPDDATISPPASAARLSVCQHDRITHVTFPNGRVDGNTVRELYESASVLVNSAQVRFLVDFTGIDMVNSGAMGMMVTLKKRCMSEGAQFHIAIPDPNVRKQFQIMNLHLILSIYSSAGDAIAHFKE
jgi:anti-sigma B factor antagonist